MRGLWRLLVAGCLSSRIACCPVSRRFCNFGSVGQAPSCTPTVHQWGIYWGGPIQSPGPGPERHLNWSVHWLSCCLTPSGWLNCKPLPPRSALLCCPGKVQGPSPECCRVVKDRDNSPALMTPRAVLPSTIDGKGQGGRGGCLSHAHATSHETSKWPGQLSQAMCKDHSPSIAVARGEVSSPALLTPEPALP